nr:hypothetical protein [Ornithinimicrobium sp. HY1745]
MRGDVVLKPYPSCGYSLRLIDAALALRPRIGDVGTIARVTCIVSPRADDVLRFRQPASENEGRFSAEFATASALVDGVVGLETFAKLSDGSVPTAVRDVIGKTERSIDEPVASLGEERSAVEVLMSDGTVVREEVRYPTGHSQRPMSRTQRSDKFTDCTSWIWSTEEGRKRFDAVDSAPLDQPTESLLEGLLGTGSAVS